MKIIKTCIVALALAPLVSGQDEAWETMEVMERKTSLRRSRVRQLFGFNIFSGEPIDYSNLEGVETLAKHYEETVRKGSKSSKTSGKGKGSKSSKGKGSHDCYEYDDVNPSSKSPGRRQLYGRSYNQMRRGTKSSKGKGSKSSKTYNDCDAVPTAPPVPTASPVIANLGPTAAPTPITCDSQNGRLIDIATISNEVLGTGNTSPAEAAALDWLTNTDTSNSCADGGVAMRERFILALFYYRTDGDNWVNSSGWLSTSDHCTTWFGIDCQSPITQDATVSRIYSISLNENNVSGEIPSEFSMLSNLGILKLFNNQLFGQIPGSLYELPNLTFIDVESNNLQGTAFNDDVMKATKLLALRLSFNDFEASSIPSNIGVFTQLKQLWIAGAEITGQIPPEITNLSELEQFFAFENKLRGTIPDLSTLRNLERINFADNQLIGSFPESLGNLPSLNRIVLSNNLLDGQLMTSVGNLILLEEFLIANNTLTGPFPSTEFSNLSRMVSLDLENNEFTGFLPNYSDWNALSFININNNGFYGSIDASLFDKQDLQRVYFSNNTLTGPVPYFGASENLIDLWLNGNFLDGTIPNVDFLPNITEVLLSDNLLEGPMPQSICDLRDEDSDFFVPSFEFLHADCLPPSGTDQPNNACDYPECCTTCTVGKIAYNR